MGLVKWSNLKEDALELAAVAVFIGGGLLLVLSFPASSSHPVNAIVYSVLTFMVGGIASLAAVVFALVLLILAVGIPFIAVARYTTLLDKWVKDSNTKTEKGDSR